MSAWVSGYKNSKIQIFLKIFSKLHTEQKTYGVREYFTTNRHIESFCKKLSAQLFLLRRLGYYLDSKKDYISHLFTPMLVTEFYCGVVLQTLLRFFYHRKGTGIGCRK